MFKTQPYPHQQMAFDLFKDKSYFALFTDMGTGKTKMLLDIAAYKYNKKEIDCMVILAPKQVVPNWTFIEIEKHLGIPHTVAQFRNPMKVKEKEQIFNLYLSKKDIGLRILTMNIDAARCKDGFKCLSNFLAKFRCFLVIDESTSIKNPSASVTKNLLKLSRKAWTKAISTGYPAPQSCLDYYSQMEFLREGLSGFKSFFFYKCFYAITKKIRVKQQSREDDDKPKGFGREVTIVTGFKNQEKLTDLLDSFALRIKKEECLDLPEKIDIPQIIELTTEQKKVYVEVAKRCMSELAEDQEITVTSAITKIMKLHQVACGHVKLDNGDWIDLPNNRLETLKNIVEELPDEKIIIWAHYKKDIENIHKMLGESSVTFYGDTVDTQASLAAFHNDPKIRYIIINPKSGMSGLTLVESSLNIYYSYSYNLEHWLQSRDRTHRIGQKNNVRYILFYCKGTVEEKILSALREKKQLSDEILNNITNYVKEGMKI